MSNAPRIRKAAGGGTPESREGEMSFQGEEAVSGLSIEERLARGLAVSQEDWDRAAAMFADDLEEAPLSPAELAKLAPPKMQRAPLGLQQLLRDAFADLENEGRKK